ncbi:DUF3800 domain-containing protein [Litorimonas haliclonae]|uniref:DUF3800 domain-containing protein n=1 Tax=Litorimonas haliclonae TaxID=2081977 RepID=UPI0039EE3164
MSHTRYIIYCDESDAKGRFYSNFYGGALIRADRQFAIEQELQAKKDFLNVFEGEMKWEKVTPHYKAKYIDFLETFFDIIERGDLKVRIMFTHNQNIPNLQDYQVGNDYLLLYYQFIKHAFGLRYSVPQNGSASAMVLLDDLPSDQKSIDQFRTYLSDLSNYPVWSRAKFSIAFEDITAINSKGHNILQGLDIILGGINSRLNEKHTRVVPPAKRRSKRARAKEEVYAVIKRRVKRLYPNFNFGTGTGTPGGLEDRFNHPYRHWLFLPNNSTHDPNKTKKASRKK